MFQIYYLTMPGSYEAAADGDGTLTEPSSSESLRPGRSQVPASHSRPVVGSGSPAWSLLHPHGGAAHSHCTMRNFSGSRESVFLMIPLSDLIHDTLYNDCKGQWSFKFIFGSSGLVSLRALTLSLQLSLAPETLSLSLSPHRPRMLPGPTEAV